SEDQVIMRGQCKDNILLLQSLGFALSEMYQGNKLEDSFAEVPTHVKGKLKKLLPVFHNAFSTLKTSVDTTLDFITQTGLSFDRRMTPNGLSNYGSIPIFS